MLLKEFYEIFYTEESTVKYLKDNGLLPCVSNCHKCGNEVKSYLKHDRGKVREVLRCRKKGCQTTQSVRKLNSFFTYVDASGRNNSGLSLSEIVEIVFFFTADLPISQIVKFTGRSKGTVSDWMNLCREIPQRLFEKRQPLGGIGKIVQVDECLLCDAPKNIKGCPKLSNKKSKDDCATESKFNYSRNLNGLWVVCLCSELENDCIDARFFIVKKRDREALHKIIQNEVLSGSIIHSNSWIGYNGITANGYIQKTVNNSDFENHMDPPISASTQRIQSLWKPLKLKLIQKLYGKNDELLEKHLIEYWWRCLNKNNEFEHFMRDMKQLFL